MNLGTGGISLILISGDIQGLDNFYARVLGKDDFIDDLGGPAKGGIVDIIESLDSEKKWH